MSWEEYVKQAKISEEKFAKNLIIQYGQTIMKT